MPPRKQIDRQIPADKTTVNRLYNQLDIDLMWLSERADPETKCMAYDLMDHICVLAHRCTLEGNAPGSFRRIFEKLQRVLDE